MLLCRRARLSKTLTASLALCPNATANGAVSARQLSPDPRSGHLSLVLQSQVNPAEIKTDYEQKHDLR
jgi:hypothetical protein